MNLEALMKCWCEDHDEITDIDAELCEVKENIQKFKERDQPRKLKDEEAKLALLLKIIQAQKPLLKPKQIFSDQEIESLKNELEVDDLEEAQKTLKEDEEKRPKTLQRPKALAELDYRILNLKKLISLFQCKSRQNSQSQQPIDYQTELHKLCTQEEVKSKQDAEDQLQTNAQGQRRENLKRIIHLFNLIGDKADDSYNEIDYTNAISINQVNPSSSNQDYAIEKAQNAMILDQNMPFCFQRLLTEVIYFSTLLLHETQDKINKKEAPEMRSQLGMDIGSLTNESAQFTNQEVKQQIHEISQFGGDNNEFTKVQLQKILTNMKSVQLKHRLFNFKEFDQLLTLNEKSANDLKNREIILLLGSTGCGKSTTVHYLCGSKMNKTQIDDLIHISATKVINKKLKKVKSSAIARSETRYVTPIDIDLAQLGKKQNQVITLVDTPGSQDTESCEVDISNCLGIIKAVRKASGVRIAILFSYLKLGAKGEDIKSLIGFYGGMLKDIDKYLKSFSFFFTHVPEEITFKNLHATLKDGFGLLTEQEKQNEGLVSLFRDIVQKSEAAVEGQGSQFHILRPLDGKPIKILDGILKTEILTSTSSFIERIDQKGRFQINQQFKMHSEAIVSAIKRNDGNYALYLLEELIQFQKVFPQEQVFLEKIKQTAKDVIFIGQQLFKQGMEGLEKAFQVQRNNSLADGDLKLFKQNHDIAKQFIDPFYERILAEDRFLDNKEYSKEKFQSYQYFKRLREMLEESLDIVILNTNNIADPIWNRYLQKYQKTFNFFNEKYKINEIDGFSSFLESQIIIRLQEIFKQAVEQLTGDIRQKLDEMSLYNCIIIEESTNKSPIQQISASLNQLISASSKQEQEYLKNLLNNSILEIQECIQNKCNDLRDTQLKDIMEKIHSMTQASEQIASEEEKKFYEEDFFFQIKPQQVENITNYFLMHQNFSLNLSQINGINSQFTDQLQIDIIYLKKQFLQIYFRNEEKLKSVIRKKGSKHKNIKLVYDQIQSIRRVPFIENETKIRYESVITLLEQFVYDKKQLVEELIPNIDKLIQIKGSRIDSPLSQLKESLRAIKDLRELLPESDQFFSTIVRELITRLVSLAENLKQEASSKQLNFEEIKQIKDLDQIYQQINDIQQISFIIDEKIEISNIDVIDVKNTIHKYLTQIEHFLKNKNDPEKQKDEGSEKYNTVIISRNQCSNIEQMLIFLYTINQESPLIKHLGLLDQSRNLSKELQNYIEMNPEIQEKQFLINLQIIRQLCGLESSAKKEEDKNCAAEIDKTNMSIIEIQVNNAVKNICDRLKLFKDINKYPELRQYFDNENEKEKSIYGNLRKFLKDLGEQMQTLHNLYPVQFNINISIITNLQLLDRIVKDEKCNTTFQKIHDEAFQILLKNKDEFEKEALKAIEQGNYQQFQEIIENEEKVQKLNKQSSKDNKIETILRKHLIELRDKVNRKLSLTINNLNDDSNIEDLDETIQKITDILTHIKETYIGTANSISLKEIRVKFYSQLIINADKVKQQSGQFIKNKKFYEAFRIINMTVKMFEKITLDYNTDNQLQFQQNQQNKEEDIRVMNLNKDAKQKIIELNAQLKYLNTTIQEEANSFKRCNQPSDLKFMNAKQICDDLQLIINIQGKVCDIDTYQQTIIKSILDIYNDQITYFQILIAQQDYIVSFENKKHISEIKNSLLYVSDHVKNEIKLKIEVIEQSIDKKIEELSTNLQQILQTQDVLNLDFTNLSKLLQHRKNNLSQEDKQSVDQQCLKMILQFEKFLNQDPINEKFQKFLDKLYDIQSISIQVHLLPDTKQKITILQQKIAQIPNEMFNILLQQLKSLKNESDGNKSKAAEIENQSPLLSKNKFIETFQMMMKIPKNNQARVNPNLNDDIIKIAQTGFKILQDVEDEFSKCKINKNFLRGIDIMNQLQQNQLAIKCLQHQSFELKCRELNDQRLMDYIDFFKNFSIEKICFNQLFNAFNTQFKYAEENLAKMKVDTIIKQDLQFLKETLDILQIFADREELFKELKPKEKFIKISEDLQNIIQCKINKLQIQDIKQYFLPDFNETAKFKEKINFFIDIKSNLHLEVVDQHFKQIQSQFISVIPQICQDVISLISKDLNNPNEKQISQFLIKFQLLKDSFNDEIKKSLSQSQFDILVQVNNQFQFKADFIKKFHDVLQNDNIGIQIINQHKILQELLDVQKWTQFTDDQLKIDLNMLIGSDQINSLPLIDQKENNIDSMKLFEGFRSFESTFNTSLRQVFEKKTDSKNLLVQLRKLLDTVEISQIADIIPEVLGIIFCIYFINEKRSLQKINNFEEFKKSGFQPKKEQVIALLRMFGFGYIQKQGQKKKLFNNLIDINLNEENGLINCVASSIFAIKGYQVSCACPNKNIKERDFNKYFKFFNILEISNLINYETLPKICVSYIQSQFDQTIQNAYQFKILKNHQNFVNQSKKIENVMLIYDIETLCSFEFQKQIEEIPIKLKNNEIENCIRKACQKSLEEKKKKKGISFFKSIGNFVKSIFSSEDKRESFINEGFQKLVDLSLERNIRQNLELQDYISKLGGQQLLDGQSINLELVLLIGKFLLSEIPQNFAYIMGLTQNFMSFDPHQKQVMQKYSINDFTFFQKLYKNTKNPQIQIIPENDKFKYIEKHIEELRNKNASILVIFDSQDTIDQYCSETNNQFVLGNNGLITGELNNQINLISRENVIGIDFKITGPSNVNIQQGLHVIQTFITDSESQCLNINRIASHHIIIESDQCSQKQNDSVIDYKNFKEFEFEIVNQIHQQSMKYREFVFSRLPYQNQIEQIPKKEQKELQMAKNNLITDNDLQQFLIQLNKLDIQQESNEEIDDQYHQENHGNKDDQVDHSDQVTIVIIIDNARIINNKFFDKMMKKIKDILDQQQQDNIIFNIDQGQKSLRFRIYFLGASGSDVHDELILDKQDIKNVEGRKQLIATFPNNESRFNFTAALSKALSNATVTEKQISHIVFLSYQGIKFNTLKQNHTDKLPPVYPYFYNVTSHGDPMQYNSFKDISTDGKGVTMIGSNQEDQFFNKIQFEISYAFCLKNKSKIDEDKQNDFVRTLRRRCNLSD